MEPVGGIFGDRTLYDIAVDFGAPTGAVLLVVWLVQKGWKRRADIRAQAGRAADLVLGMLPVSRRRYENEMDRHRREVAQSKLDRLRDLSQSQDEQRALSDARDAAETRARLLELDARRGRRIGRFQLATTRRLLPRPSVRSGWAPRSTDGSEWEAVWESGAVSLTSTHEWAIGGVLVTAPYASAGYFEEQFTKVRGGSILRVVGLGTEHRPDAVVVEWANSSGETLRATVPVLPS